MTVLPNDFTLAKFVRLSPTTGGVVLVEQDEEQSKGVRLTTVMKNITMTLPVHPLNSIIRIIYEQRFERIFQVLCLPKKNPKMVKPSRRSISILSNVW